MKGSDDVLISDGKGLIIASNYNTPFGMFKNYVHLSIGEGVAKPCLGLFHLSGVLK